MYSKRLHNYSSRKQTSFPWFSSSGLKFLILILSISISGLLHAQQYSQAFDIFDKDDARSGTSTSDGGYAFTGLTTDANGAHVYFAKVNANGNLVWHKEIGLNSSVGNRIEELNTGGFIIAGKGNGALSPAASALLIRTDQFGNQIWARNYGGLDGSEEFYAVLDQYPLDVLDPYRFVSAGIAFNAGDRNMYITKVADNGNFLDGHTFDFGANDAAYSILKVSGGFIVTGSTNLGIAGTTSLVLMKLDRTLNVVWAKSYSGSGNEEGLALANTSDGNILVTGYSDSYSNGKQDVLLMKVNPDNGTRFWAKVYGRRAEEVGTSVQESSDGGIILTGHHRPTSTSSQDIFLLKLDANGGIIWDEKFSTIHDDVAYSVEEAADGSLLIAGEIRFLLSPSIDETGDAYIIKTNSVGQGACEKSLNFLTRVVEINAVDLSPTVLDYGTGNITLQYLLLGSPGFRSLCCKCEDVVVDFSYISASTCISGTPADQIHAGDLVTLTSEAICTDRIGWFINGELMSTDEIFNWTPSTGGVYSVSLKGRLQGCDVVEHIELITVVPDCYCASSGTSSAFSYINSMCWTDICYGTGDNGGYAFNPINFTASRTIPNYFSIDPSIFSLPGNAFFNVWIDYDQSGTFDTALGELVYHNYGSGTQSGFISIPATAFDGTTMMRIQMKVSSTGIGTIPDPCENFTSGEVEDYLMTILPLRVGALSNSFKVWPNPAANTINLQFNAGTEASQNTISITDLNGKVQYLQNTGFIDGEFQSNIDITDLANGIYLLNVINKLEVKTSKIEVIH